MKIEDHIPINIHEVVSLALLGIDESLDLKTLINRSLKYLISLVKVVGLNSLEGLLVLGPWELSLHAGLRVVVWVLKSQEVYKRV